MKIFQKVHCKSYLQKYSDGVFLRTWQTLSAGDFGVIKERATGNSWGEPIFVKAYKNEYINGMWEEKELADLSSFEGETVPKEYRRRIEEEFDGFLVGFTHIVVRGQIGTDTSDYVYNMNGDLREVYHLTKHTEMKKVGVVYFKNNAKRYVPIEDIEVKNEIEPPQKSYF